MFSKIIIECVLTRIDLELQNESINYSRFVDDYEIYIYNDGEEKRIESIFTNILRCYGFAINYEKTQTVDFPYYVVKNLEKIFFSYCDSLEDGIESSELMEMFDTYFLLEKEGVEGAIRYLIKSLEKILIKPKAPLLYKAYLLTIISNDDRSLTKTCSLIINNKDIIELNETDVNFINGMLDNHLKYEHDLEVIWLIYLLIMTEKQISENNYKNIINSRNELAQILLLRNKLLDRKSLNTISENAVSWILLYELYAKNIIEEDELKIKLNLDKNLRLYNYLKINDIHFV